MNAKQIVASYLIFQSVCISAWWGLLLSEPQSIAWFQPVVWPPDTLLCFWLPDTALLVAGSLATAFAILTGKRWATVSMWAIAAAVWYPTLYCLGVSIMTDEAWIASSIRSPEHLSGISSCDR